MARFAVLAFALVITAARPAAAQAMSMSDALRIAEERAPEGLVPLGITRNEDAFEVLFAGEDGSRTLVVDASSGRVLEQDRARIVPRRGTFRSSLGRQERRQRVRLSDAVEAAERRYDAPLKEVALQEVNGRVIVEVDLVEDGRVAGRLFDPRTGREIVG